MTRTITRRLFLAYGAVVAGALVAAWRASRLGVAGGSGVLESGAAGSDADTSSAEDADRAVFVIAQPCVKDRACADVCPVDAIHEGPDQLFIHPDECIGCGACERECPVGAIFERSEVPPEWASYIAKNRDFFLAARRGDSAAPAPRPAAKRPR